MGDDVISFDQVGSFALPILRGDGGEPFACESLRRVFVVMNVSFCVPDSSPIPRKDFSSFTKSAVIATKSEQGSGGNFAALVPHFRRSLDIETGLRR